MSPLRARAGSSSGNRLRHAVGRLDPVKARSAARLSAAAVMVFGVGAASALFVDYLADRAISRNIATIEVEPLVNTAVAEMASMSSVARAQAAPVVEIPAAPAAVTAAPPAEPTTPAEPAAPAPMPIEAVLPDAAAIARVAVGPEHAIEVPADDPTDDPLLSAYDGDAGRGGASDEITAAIAADEAEPEPVARPRKAKVEKARPAAQSRNTEVASLPGVDVGGLAGHPSGNDDRSASKVRTVTKQASASAVAAGTARVRQAVNMRAAPKKGAGILGVVPTGTSVSVLSCDRWCQVSYNGRKGWVYKSFLTLGASKKQTAAAPKKTAKPGASSRL